MTTPAQKKAHKNYEQNTRFKMALSLNRQKDAEIIKYLKNIDNVSGYIKDLILKDMRENQ